MFCFIVHVACLLRCQRLDKTKSLFDRTGLLTVLLLASS
ncbi:hypothetical protein NECAME_02007 [Necator americanus]|uniref:Uncharacterized protein n=1 Tax=Necator americanus TaxID=51031 RepID=W2TJM7_NECAM|nr:hypothetical protein NECAME_02007 [Necator americanus]ETN82270.1 hypothetical protein NECAME_02007 [Necator americanus]